MRFSSIPGALLLALTFSEGATSAASDDKKPPVEPCTIASATGSFFDLRALSILPLEEGKKAGKNDKVDSWHAKGYDYNANFTLNVCAPVMEPLEDVVGVGQALWNNISAFYEHGDKTYSLGQQSSNLTLRGRRLVLQYTGGSPCAESKKRSPKRWDDDEDEEDDDKNEREISGSRRKSATISFHCDKDPLATTSSATFVGVDPDECAYSFEVLSRDACTQAQPAKQGVGPGAVFAIIGVIAIMVYFLGGVFYQRNVAHARGWRQLPNYSMWAGIGSFVKDVFIIATSSCARFMPSRRGYSSLSVSADGNGRGRDRDDENRLIDQLDEEWDD